MSKRYGPRRLPAESISDHPATRAWSRVAGSSGRVRGIAMLTERNKSSVYRLEVVGWQNQTVIAKLSAGHYGGGIGIEQFVYHDVLPSIGLSAILVYGHTEAETGPGSWMFLEDL